MSELFILVTKRQIKLAHGYLESIYTQILHKVDPERGKLLEDASVILTSSENDFRFSHRGAWFSEILEKSMKEEWFQQTIEEWLQALEKETGPLDSRMILWINGLLKNIALSLVINGKSVLAESKIIILS